MRWVIGGLALVFLPMMIAIGWPAERGQIAREIEQKKVVLGQSPRDVRTIIGEPTKITRKSTYWDSTEDWVYGEGAEAMRFTFQQGRLTRISKGERPNLD